MWGQTKHTYVYGGVKQNTCMCTVGSNKTHVCVRWGQTKHTYVYGGVKQNTMTFVFAVSPQEALLSKNKEWLAQRQNDLLE